MAEMYLPAWNEVSSRSMDASMGQAAIGPSQGMYNRDARAANAGNESATSARPGNKTKQSFGHYVNEHKSTDTRNNAYGGSLDGRRDGFAERDSVFDEFKYRELCLNAASRTKTVTTYLTKIKDHILKEASLDWEAAASFGAFMDEADSNGARYGRSYISSAPVPKEAMILENSSTELQNAASMCIKAVSECLQSRKTIYLTQLKKIRETSNMATRNAVQHERSEAAAYMQRLKESLETQRRTEVRACEARIVDLENTVSSLRSSLETAQNELSRLTELDHNRTHLQNSAVAAAVEQCRRDHAQDRERLQAGWATERQRIQTDTQAQIEEMKRQNEAHIEVQRQHEREMRDVVLQEKARAEAETAKVREELVNTVAKLTSERERSVARLQEEREKAERDQQAALAEAVRGQASLRAELAATVQRVQMDALKQEALKDQEMTKYREQLLTQHSLEIEKINERHRNEMKKYHAELQVRMQDATTKLKHIHEQEIQRLIRDNERLHRIIVRHGGAEMFRNVDVALPGTAAGDALNVTVDESVNASYHNAAQSPGFQFTGAAATKSLRSKSPIYSSKIRTALTPPGKFRHGHNSKAGRSPEEGGYVAGVAGARAAAAAGAGAGGSASSGDGDVSGPAGAGSGVGVRRGVNFGPGPAEEATARLAGHYAHVPDSPPPPPRHPVMMEGDHWGALRESLKQQEQAESRPKYSSTHLPPDAFALDASLAQARSGTNRQLGVGIGPSAERNREYLKELDRYLQHGDSGRGKADGRIPDSILRELPGTLGSVLETSSHSSGHFNAMLEHNYNRERERMGLRPPKSPAYDSDSDQPSSDDELAGTDITLSATKMATDNR